MQHIQHIQLYQTNQTIILFFVFILERMLQGALRCAEVPSGRHVVLLHLSLPDKLQVGVSYPAPDVIALLTNVY